MKVRVGILCGGKSGEHEVSLQSAKNIAEAIDRDKYDVVMIGIDKTGAWALYESDRFLVNAHDPKRIGLGTASGALALNPGARGGPLTGTGGDSARGAVDVVFPVLHGPFGEDGTVQGMLKLADLPFVGAGVLGSAVGMDKDVMKRLLRDDGIPVADFRILHRSGLRPGFAEITAALGCPLFVKPANYGSSIGVAKVADPAAYQAALDDAFLYDRKVIVEEAIVGREIECSVLGNDDPRASLPGEIVPHHDFYSYDAKYIDENGAALFVPADLPEATVRAVQDLSIRAFKALCCEGMARVDLFLARDGRLVLNEINTIPGFTRISMYPKLWEVSGLGYTDLIDRLIQLALERHREEKALKTDYQGS